jgi:3-oxoacyl-ACP reductase-like protein
LRSDLEAEIDVWNDEFDDFFKNGIKPKFSSKKVRHYKSYWNWAIQDIMEIILGTSNWKESDSWIQTVYKNLINRPPKS